MYSSIVVGTPMAGISRDGVERRKAILAVGCSDLGEDEATSEVYGRNKTSFIEGAIKAQFALDVRPGILQDIPGFGAGVQEPTTPD
jgi:two-component system chemotaxis response regulator CheB